MESMKINLTKSGMNVVTTTSLSVLRTRKSCLCTRRSHVTTTTTRVAPTSRHRGASIHPSTILSVTIFPLYRTIGQRQCRVLSQNILHIWSEFCL